MRILWAASLRHLLRHPAQLLLALAGLALGVAPIAAVDVAPASAYRAFLLSIDAVNGSATHEIEAGPAGIDEALYVKLAREGLPIAFAPVVEGYVAIGERSMQLIGIDPFANPGFRDDELLAAGAGGGHADPGRWFSTPGAVMMAQETASELHLARGQSFAL